MWYNLSINQRETVVFDMGKKAPANTAVLSQLKAENAALKEEVEKLRNQLDRMSELLLNAPPTGLLALSGV